LHPARTAARSAVLAAFSSAALESVPPAASAVAKN